jgi:hypothetical protein
MAKKVFVYGGKVINDDLPETEDILSMLRSMDHHLKIRQAVASIQKNSLNPRRKPVKTNKKDVKSRNTRVPKKEEEKQTLVAIRVPYQARVILHKNHRYLKGVSLNISKSGMFVAAEKPVFRIDEAVNVFIKPTGKTKGINAVCKIRRYNGNGLIGPKGYGLQFI